MKKLFLLLVIIFNINTYACSCDEKPSVKQSFYDSKEVFTGKVIRVDSTHFSSYGYKIYLFTIKIINYYKRNSFDKSEEIHTLFSRKNLGMCDFNFKLGKEYVIYEAQDVQRYESIMNFATTCSRTALLSNVKKEELDELKQLSKIDIKDVPEIEYIVGVTSKEFAEYNQLKLQAENTQKLAEQNKYLMILYAIIFIAAIVFFILYIKTKKKLKAAKKI